MMIAIKAFYPETGEVHDMAPKTISDFAAWMERGFARGYKSYDLGDVVRFESKQPGNPCVFTAKMINATCAMDYVNW